METTNTANTAPDKKISWLTKITYGTTGVSTMLSSVLVTTYVFYFYTDVLHIPAGAATTIALIGRIWGWLVDPAMGVFVENAKPGKYGATRKIILQFAIPGGLALALSFAVPGVSTGLQVVWVAVTYILQATLNSLLTLTKSTLMSRITTDRVQRANMQQVYSILGTIVSLTMTSETLNLVNTLGGGDMRRGFMITAAIFGVAYALFYLFFFIATKGMEPIEETAAAGTVSKGPGLKEILPALATKTMWLAELFISIFYTTFSMMQAQTMVTYFTHCLGDAQTPLRIYSSASMVVTMIGYASLASFTKRIGNAGACLLGCVLGAVGHLFRFFAHDGTMVLYGTGLVIAMFGTSLLAGTTLLIVLDTGVYSEWKTGSKSDPLLIAGSNIATKLGMTLGGAIAGYLLTAFHYDPSQGAPGEAVKNLLFYENTLLVAVGYILAALCAFFVWRYEKRIPQMQAEIEARKAQTA